MADIAAIILAAGRASRFGAAEGESKVLAKIGGVSLIRRVAGMALASRAAPVIIVTGHAGGPVAQALARLEVTIVENPDWQSGMASSLKAGVAAVPAHVTGALIVLGDMPLVRSQTLDRMIETREAGASAAAIIPVHAGRRGNPVLLGRQLFEAIAGLSGDEGARTLLRQPDLTVALCPVDDEGVTIDVDTRDGLAALVARQID